MTAPVMTPPPPAPQRTDPPATFSDRADAFLAWLVNWYNDLVDVIAWLNTRTDEAETAVIEAEEARDKAALWADAPEDTEVEPGRFSALHYAEKAEVQVQLAADQVALAADQVQLATDEADRATAEASDAEQYAINAAQSAAAAEAAGGMGNLAILQATALSF